MGYLVVLRASRPITKAELEEFRATVPDRKSCPIFLGDDEGAGGKVSATLYVNGSWSASGDLKSSFSHRCIRWFGKVKGVKLSHDYHAGDSI